MLLFNGLLRPHMFCRRIIAIELPVRALAVQAVVDV